MLIQIFSFTGFQGSVNIEPNTLTQESLNEVLRSVEVNPGNNSVISYSYKTEAGKQTGDFTENTVINSNAVVITIQVKETKARYTEEEIEEVISEAKIALVSQEYKALRTSCRDLSQVSTEIKEVIGNYTHYSVSSLISAIERALNILQPNVIEVTEEQVQRIFDKIEELEGRIANFENSTPDQALNEELEAIKSDLAFIGNHLGIVLPNHSDRYTG